MSLPEFVLQAKALFATRPSARQWSQLTWSPDAASDGVAASAVVRSRAAGSLRMWPPAMRTARSERVPGSGA